MSITKSNFNIFLSFSGTNIHAKKQIQKILGLWYKRKKNIENFKKNKIPKYHSYRFIYT